MPGTFSPPPTSKETVSSRHVYHARVVMHVGIANEPAVAGKTFLTFPAHAQPAILRIWQEVHTANFVVTAGGTGCRNVVIPL